MIFITGLFVLFFVAYTVIMRAAHGKLNSISEGFYKLKADGNDQWLFITMMVVMAGYLFALTVVTENWLFGVAMAGAMIVAGSAQYKKEVYKFIHYGGTAMIVGGATIGIGVEFCNWWALAGIIFQAAIFYFFWKGKLITNPMYLAEMGTFILIILGVSL